MTPPPEAPRGLKVYLGKGRDRSVKAWHPWIFSRAVAGIEGDDVAGECQVFGANREFLAMGIYSPPSQIRVRVFSWRRQPLDRAFFVERLRRAWDWRQATVAPVADAWRWVNAEGDGLPALIVDRYPGALVVEVASAGLEALRGPLEEALVEVAGDLPRLNRNRLGVRRLEGLSQEDSWSGAPPVSPLAFREHQAVMLADLAGGQKTGFFLDQRANRERVRRLSSGRRVLNAFSYSCGFGVAARLGGAASVVNVDSSAAALELGRALYEANGLLAAESEFHRADALPELRRRVAAGERYDLVILDPPAFVKNARELEAGERGYREINVQALKLLDTGGLLATFSCSGGVSRDAFETIVQRSARDAGVSLQILERLGPDLDHPVSIYCPQGDYLKGLLCRKF